MENKSHQKREFTFEFIKRITNDFSEDRIVGRGAYGVVYKAVLDDGEEIAVKKLRDMLWLDDQQFKNEFDNLSRVQHPNILRLVGYCHHMQQVVAEYNGELVSARQEDRALCFEYLQGGSLDQHLSDEFGGFDWQTRFSIIKGICNGLFYLHNGSKKPIYHLDLKPANILLDKNQVPKIGDFGLSRLCASTQTYTTKNMIGTPGYMPPEYIDKQQISSKFDVFSLGVVIINVMTGPLGYSKCADMSPQEFSRNVHENWLKRLQTTILSLTSEVSEQVKTCIEIALRCVEADRTNRPTITDIVEELNMIDSPSESASSYYTANSSFSTSSSGGGEGNGEEPARTSRRPELIWTPQLHKRFVDAVGHIGLKNAMPKTIMQRMNVDGLTRENVASHLQKYRLYLKRMHRMQSTPSPTTYTTLGSGMDRVDDPLTVLKLGRGP